MTWGQAKEAALVKMFLPPGAVSGAAAEYREAMPHAAAEGVMALVALSAGPVRLLEIEHTPPPEGGAARYDLPALCDDFYRLKEDGVRCRYEGGAEWQNPPYSTEENGVLAIDDRRRGLWRVPYFALPKLPGAATPNEERLPLREDAAALLPLYMASCLYRDEDLQMAMIYKNEFEAGAARLPKPPPPQERFGGA